MGLQPFVWVREPDLARGLGSYARQGAGVVEHPPQAASTQLGDPGQGSALPILPSATATRFSTTPGRLGSDGVLCGCKKDRIRHAPIAEDIPAATFHTSTIPGMCSCSRFGRTTALPRSSSTPTGGCSTTRRLPRNAKTPRPGCSFTSRSTWREAAAPLVSATRERPTLSRNHSCLGLQAFVWVREPDLAMSSWFVRPTTCRRRSAGRCPALLSLAAGHRSSSQP